MKTRIKKVEMLLDALMTDGAHHKQWYLHGAKTNCANCGKEYIQDMKQEFLDDWTTEYHPDIRILCPECMPRGSGGKAK